MTDSFEMDKRTGGPAPRVGSRACRQHRSCLHLIAGLLVLASLLSCLSGVVATAGLAPDENAHYGYIKHLADHYGEFPIDYANMFLYSREHPNTATHPPLYYYILATAYRVLQPNRHFTEIVREKDRYSSGISRSSVVPILRTVSWLLAGVGLLGVYRLMRYFIRVELLRPGLAVVAVAMFSFIPAYFYIAGVLNNDVAVFMLWPFIVLYSTKYYLTGRWSSFWKAVFVLAAGILSKGTFWLFVMGFAGLILARLALDLRNKGLRGWWRNFAGAGGPRRGPRRYLSMSAWALLGLAMTAAAVIHVTTNLTRYGQLHPDARNIHKTPDGRSLLPPLPPPGLYPHKSFHRIGEMAASRLLTTTTGFLSHAENLFHPNHAGLVPLFRVLLGVSFLSVCGFLFGRFTERRLKTLVLVYVAIVVAYYVLYVYVQYKGWPRAGHVTAQGRYFIGYTHLMVLLLFVMASQQLFQGSHARRAAKNAVFWPCVCVLFLILCDPLFYLRNTLESYRRAGIEEIVKTDLRSRGFERVPISLWAPQGLFADYGRQADRADYRLAHPASTIGGEICIPASGCGDLEVVVWARGDEALNEKARLGIGLREPSAGEDRSSPDAEEVRRLVEAGEEIEVYTTRIPIAELAGSRRLLFVRLMNQPVFESRLMNEIWPRTRSVILYGLYYRLVGCRYQETARRPAGLNWHPLANVTIEEDRGALRLQPTGPDARLETNLTAPKGPGQTVLVLHVESAQSTTIQWFLDLGAGYREQDSVIRNIAAGPGDITIHLPAGLKSLRLDPEQPLTIRAADLVDHRWLPTDGPDRPPDNGPA